MHCVWNGRILSGGGISHELEKIDVVFYGERGVH